MGMLSLAVSENVVSDLLFKYFLHKWPGVAADEF